MKKVLCSAALVLVTAGWGYADSVTYSDSIPSTAVDWSNTLSVAKFDSTLGTLTGITVTLDGTFDSQAWVGPKSGYTSTEYKDSSSTAEISVYTPWDATTILLQINPTGVTFTSGAWVYTTGTYLNSTGSDSVIDSVLNTYWSYFTGTGTVDLDIDTFTYGSAKVKSSGFFSPGGSARAQFSVTYDYTTTPPAIPEPATMLLFGTGLLGLAGVARRRVM